jgi:hypothetical protein
LWNSVGQDLIFSPLVERKHRLRAILPKHSQSVQWVGREKFFERKREVDPDLTVWASCVLACEAAGDRVMSPR